MGDWYTIGLSAGLGSAVGVVLCGLLGSRRAQTAVAALVAAAAGAGIGLVIEDWGHAISGAGGGIIGAVTSAVVLAGAARRGGRRAGLAFFAAIGALALAGLAFVPGLGYLEALALPAVAARMVRGAAERYAGLRTLAK